MRKRNYFIYKQKGLSLLEIIISLALGVIILLALGSVYQAASYSSMQSSDIIDMNAKANKIMSLLGQDFEQAGYVDLFDKSPLDENKSNAQIIFSMDGGDVEAIFGRTKSSGKSPFESSTGLFPIQGCDGMITSDNGFRYEAVSGGVAGVSNLKDASFTCDRNGVSGDGAHQSIEIAYQSVSNKQINDLSVTSGAAPQLNSLQTQAEEKDKFNGAGLDCAGHHIDDDQKGIVRNLYYLDGTSFKCKGSAKTSDTDSPPVELVSGIQQLVLRYRVTSPSSGAGSVKIASGQQTDNVFSAQDVMDNSKNPLGWYAVTGVQVCLLLKSDNLHRTSVDLEKLQKDIPSCTGKDSPRIAGDKAYYKRYVSTFSLPNLINFTY